MINSVTFAERLKKIMAHYNLNASAFSNEIDFNRSTISHLISGRNKPSLEFIMKVLNRFPEVSINWLLYDEGVFPKVKNDKSALKEPIHKRKKVSFIEETKPSNEIFGNKAKSTALSSNFSNNKKDIKKIVVFYTDFTFETYEN